MTNRMIRPTRLTLPRFTKKVLAQRLQLTADVRIHTTQEALRDLRARDETWVKFFGGRLGWSGRELLYDAAGLVVPLKDAAPGVKLLAVPYLAKLYHAALEESGKDFC